MALVWKVKIKRKVDYSDEVDRVVRRAVWEAVKETAIAIENDVKGGPHAAPYRTGNLRRSYHVELMEAKLTARVGSDDRIAPYAPYVELGTSRQRAQPHLRPAGEAQRTAFAQRAATNLRAAMKGFQKARR